MTKKKTNKRLDRIPDVSIVIPTYNEEGNISQLVDRIHKACKNERISEEIIIVDDNSPDGTADRAIDLSKSFPIKVIIRKGKLGLSSAVMAGFGIAKADMWGVIDADLSHPPEIIPHLIGLIRDKGKDLTVGSRYVKGGGVDEWTLIRKLISKGATLLARPLTKVRDPMSGFFFFRKRILDNVKLTPKGYKILLEILVKARYRSFAEYPYVFQNREVGTSKLGSKTVLHYIKQLFDLYIYKFFR